MATTITQLSNNFSSMNLATTIPLLTINNLRFEIFSYIGGEDKYWKDIFSKKVVPQLSWKDYFDHNVVSELDKGHRLVSLWTGPCQDCREEGYAIPNPLCDNCHILEPCWNCYWYNSDPYDVGTGCNCTDNTKIVSWEEMCMSGLLKKYPRHWDFIRGQEYQEFLEREAQMAVQMREEERRAEIEIERYYIQLRQDRLRRILAIQTRIGEVLAYMARLNDLAFVDPLGQQRQIIGHAYVRALGEFQELSQQLENASATGF